MIKLENNTVTCSGTWTIPWINKLKSDFDDFAFPPYGEVIFDMSQVEDMDTTGAWFLYRTIFFLEKEGRPVKVIGLNKKASVLFDLIKGKGVMPGDIPLPEQVSFLERVGKVSVQELMEGVGLISFLGQTTLAIFRLLFHPGRIPIKAILRNIQVAGFDALPIVGLLSFLMGVVIAYQGGVQLRLYGAQIYAADLVALSMLRELAPMITAIIVAGRTGSAYTAQIGTMKVTEEIDAMITMGISPLERLVTPKLMAMIISLSLLTVYADILGVFGGLVMCNLMLDIGPATFMERVGEGVDLASYFIGVGKAPIFAANIAIIGCYQGFQVRGSAESVGQKTTTSVVQSIFIVIVIDAIFSVIFSWLGI